MRIQFDYSSKPYILELKPVDKSFQIKTGDRTINVDTILTENGRLDLLLDGQRVTAYISHDGEKRWVTVKGQTFLLSRSSGTTLPPKGRQGGIGLDRTGELTAPMPGQVRTVNVNEGDAVTKGQTLLVLEAMKMEIRIQAPGDGIVKKLLVQVGQTVDREQTLVKMDHG